MSEGTWRCSLRGAEDDQTVAQETEPGDRDGGAEPVAAAATPDRFRADAAMILGWAELLAGDGVSPQLTARGLNAIERAALGIAAHARAALASLEDLAEPHVPATEQLIIELDTADGSAAAVPVPLPAVGLADAALAEADLPCVVFDREGVVLFINEAASQLTGRRADEAVGRRLATAEAADAIALRAVVASALTAAGPVGQELDLTCADGLRHTFDCRASRIANGVVVWLLDCCEHRATEARLVHEALHDPLTGLANRRLATDRLRQALLRARRSRQPVGVLFVDLDRFKPINDAYGHIAGDAVIVQCAQRLQQTMRPGDTVARYGGDEFLVICEGTGVADQLDAIATRLEGCLTEPSSIGEIDISLGATIGRAVAQDGEGTPEGLILAADRDMYRRREGRAAGTRT